MRHLLHRAGQFLDRRFPALRERRSPYHRTIRHLVRSDRWSAERTARWQLAEVNRLLLHARRETAGHTRKFDAAGVVLPLRSLSDLEHVPFMTKDDLRSAPDDFVAKNFSADTVRFVTSGGTTGTPTRFAVDGRSYDPVFDAWRHTMWSRAGYLPGAPSLDLTWSFPGGDPLRPAGDPGRTFLSIAALTPESAAAWLPRVRAARPAFLVAFPSTAAALARLVSADDLPHLRGILLGSEKLLADQRAALVRTFPDARIFSWYGMSELAGFASGCETCDALHHWPQSGILELIDSRGSPVTAVGETGEIVLTGFSNRVTPFIRYRTGDRATLGSACTACGRAQIILTAVEGRVTDCLYSARLRVVPLSALNFHTSELDHVAAHQFFQERPGRVTLRIVPATSYAASEEAGVRRLFEARLGPDFDLEISYLAILPRTPRGKQPLIVQTCPSPALSQP